MMKNKELEPEVIEHIIERLLDYAKDTQNKLKEDNASIFYQGKELAYIEMLDVLKIELEAAGKEPSEYGIK